MKKRLKILIVDDSLYIRLKMANILSDKYTVILTKSTEEALLQFKEQKPDLVLLDIILPDGEEAGVDVLQRIMIIDADARVVMVSAVGKSELKEKCMRFGAKDYIIKPFKDEEIAEAVEKCIS